MSTLDQVLELLNKWPKWKRLTDSPDRIDELARRVEALEKRLAAPTGDICPKCREPRLELVETKPHPVMGDLGVNQHTYRCACGYTKSTTSED